MRSIQEAETQIEKILQALEIETDALVEAIELRQTDVTKLMDARERVRMSVQISLKRQPGHEW